MTINLDGYLYFLLFVDAGQHYGPEWHVCVGTDHTGMDLGEVGISEKFTDSIADIRDLIQDGIDYGYYIPTEHGVSSC